MKIDKVDFIEGLDDYNSVQPGMKRIFTKIEEIDLYTVANFSKTFEYIDFRGRLREIEISVRNNGQTKTLRFSKDSQKQYYQNKNELQTEKSPILA